MGLPLMCQSTLDQNLIGPFKQANCTYCCMLSSTVHYSQQADVRKVALVARHVLREEEQREMRPGRWDVEQTRRKVCT